MLRRLPYAASVAGLLLSIALLATGHRDWLWFALLCGGLSALGTLDVLQRKTTLRRNYPIIAHLRYGLESIGPEMRQYFVEGDTEEVPYSREQRALVYRRAKSVSDVVPFGSELDVYGDRYEWINHSITPTGTPTPITACRSGPVARSRMRQASSTSRR